MNLDARIPHAEANVTLQEILLIKEGQRRQRPPIWFVISTIVSVVPRSNDVVDSRIIRDLSLTGFRKYGTSSLVSS
jgi:hypothetical protein